MGWDRGTALFHGSHERQERHEEINKHVKVKDDIYIYIYIYLHIHTLYIYYMGVLYGPWLL